MHYKFCPHRCGYLVFHSQSVAEAITMARKKPIDLLITSLSMLETGGSDFLQRIRLINPSIGLLVISRNDPIDIIIKSFRAGAQAILSDPIHNEELISVVKEILNKNRSAKENVRFKTLLPLFEVNNSIVSDQDASKIFNRLVRIVGMETKSDNVSLMLLDELANELIIKAALGSSKAMIGKAVGLSDVDTTWSVIKTGKAILRDRKPGEINPALNDGSVVSSILCVPLSVKGKVIGVINCSKGTSSLPFTESDLELLTILAGQAAIAIENGKLFEDIKTHKDNGEVFLRRCLTAQEDERRRISTELHDGLAQWLVSASYFIQLSHAYVSMEKLEEASIEIGRAGNILGQSIKELRRLILDLHPTILAEIGLIGALQQYIISMGKETGILIDLEIKGDSKPLSSMQETVIYRICLEALNNIRKHASASKVSINLVFEPTTILLDIIDNGCGFNLEQAMRYKAFEGHIGLLSMNEKAEMVGGKLTITTAPGEGTRVCLIISSAVNNDETEIKLPDKVPVNPC